MSELTIKGVEKLYEMELPNVRSGMTVSELHTIKDWVKSNSYYPDELIYYSAMVAFHLGFKRGRNYQKRHNMAIADQPS